MLHHEEQEGHEENILKLRVLRGEKTAQQNPQRWLCFECR